MPNDGQAPSSLNQSLLCVQQLRKVREKGGHRFELHVPSLMIRSGEFIAFVGASGCGKSTLLDMLGLVMRPTSAEVFTLHLAHRLESYHIMELSEDALADIRRSEIGYVLQTGGLLPFLTVQENLLLPCRLNGMVNMEPEIHMLIERLGIGDQLTKKPQFLSCGQRQRVAIARALVHHPSLVLADEPTAAVDKPAAIDIRDTFKALTQQMGVTLCMVTHDESLVADVVDRTFIFDVNKLSLYETYGLCHERD